MTDANRPEPEDQDFYRLHSDISMIHSRIANMLETMPRGSRKRANLATAMTLLHSANEVIYANLLPHSYGD